MDASLGLKFLKSARGGGEGKNFLDDGTIREIPLGGRILIGRSQLVRKLDFIVGGRAALFRVFCGRHGISVLTGKVSAIEQASGFCSSP